LVCLVLGTSYFCFGLLLLQMFEFFFGLSLYCLLLLENFFSLRNFRSFVWIAFREVFGVFEFLLGIFDIYQNLINLVLLVVFLRVRKLLVLVFKHGLLLQLSLFLLFKFVLGLGELPHEFLLFLDLFGVVLADLIDQALQVFRFLLRLVEFDLGFLQREFGLGALQLQLLLLGLVVFFQRLLLVLLFLVVLLLGFFNLLLIFRVASVLALSV